MSYEISKDTPIPRGWNTQRGGDAYPFARMEVGDSFFAETTAKRLGTAAYCWVKYHDNGKKFTTRTENAGARIWRIA